MYVAEGLGQVQYSFSEYNILFIGTHIVATSNHDAYSENIWQLSTISIVCYEVQEGHSEI